MQKGLPSGPRSRFRAAGDSQSEYRRSDDSTSSAGSSLFDRMNSYASSLTSLDDDHHETPKPATKGRSLRTRRIEQHHSTEATSPTSSLMEHGSTVWNRVASAASELTISVSKAWAANITIHAGEETPPGADSRLTRAMKAYHREKVQSPEDLPPWLFTAEERRPVPTLRSPSIRSPTSPHSRSTDDIRTTTTGHKPRGLRDIYDAAAASQSQQALTGAANQLRSPPESKATDRLKAIRDAKRSAMTGNSKSSDNVYDDDPQQSRVGLPSGPRSRYY